jgi:hypothetical protein
MLTVFPGVTVLAESAAEHKLAVHRETYTQLIAPGLRPRKRQKRPERWHPMTTNGFGGRVEILQGKRAERDLPQGRDSRFHAGGRNSALERQNKTRDFVLPPGKSRRIPPSHWQRARRPARQIRQNSLHR